MNFAATIEIINNTKGILTLTSDKGEWAGSYRIDGQNPYELGYTRATQEAKLKGGRVNTYKVQ